jgi:glycosyltransferase involved in cell wall biosynthesis
MTPSRAATRSVPRFSVVVPCYNEESYIAGALTSLQAQRYPGDVEIIVVDNNSTDRTAEIAKGFGVRVVTEQAPGVCNARQRGTEASTGEIVVSADADTLYPPDWLQRIDQQFRADDGVVAVVGPCHYRDGPWWGRLYDGLLFGTVRLVYRATGFTWYGTATNIAFRRSAWPGYNVRFTQGGDELDLLRRLRKRGRVAYDHHNPSLTSGRRLTRGLFYNLFITLLLFYLCAYFVNRLFGRRVLGSAPAYRDDRRAVPRYRQTAAWGALAATLCLLLFSQPRHYLVSKSHSFVGYLQTALDRNDDK